MRPSLRNLGLALCLGAPLGLTGCGGHSAPSPGGSGTATAPVTSGSAGGGGTSATPGTPGTPGTAGLTVEPSALPAALAVQPTGPAPVAALAFKLAAIEDVDLAQIDVIASGSVDETALGEGVLVSDLDGDQTIGATEPQLATAPTALHDDGSYRFVLSPPLHVAAGTTVDLVVGVDASAATGLALGRLAGQTVTLAVTDAIAVLANGALGAPVVVNGSFPATGSTTLEVNSHLLISEVCTGPGSGLTSAEFVEVFNPTGEAVAIDSYYLTDFTNDPTLGEFYWQLPTGANFGPAGSAYSTDFIVKFPAGATVGAGEVVVVAIDGEGFQAAFGSAADYCLRNPGATGAAQMETWDGVAPGVNFAPSPVETSAGLTGPSGGVAGRGEWVCLFTWDGAADLVQDVDLINYGGGSYTNATVNKTAGQTAPMTPDVQVDSAYDADGATSLFQPDSDDFTQYNQRAPLGASIKRVDFLEGQEVHQGGNGLTGHNETSEDFGDGLGADGTFASIAQLADATPGRIE